MNLRTNEGILQRADSDGVVTLTLNRPAARNALSTELMAALQAEIDDIPFDLNIRRFRGNGFHISQSRKSAPAKTGREGAGI